MDWNGTPISRTLAFSSNTIPLLDLRKMFVLQATGSWSHRDEQEERLRKFSAGGLDEDAIVVGFSGDEGKDITFNFWQTDDGYELTGALDLLGSQVLPIQIYDLINDIKRKLIDPIATAHEVSVRLGEDVRNLGSRTSSDAIVALNNFGAACLDGIDETLWNDLIIASHLSNQPLGADVLRQWLVDACVLEVQHVERLLKSYEAGLRLLRSFASR